MWLPTVAASAEAPPPLLSSSSSCGSWGAWDLPAPPDYPLHHRAAGLLSLVGVELHREKCIGALCLTTQEGRVLTFDDRAARMNLSLSRLSEAGPYIWIFKNLSRLNVPCLTPVADLVIESEQEPVFS